MMNFAIFVGFAPCSGFLFFILTIVFAHILAPWLSRNWLLVALVTGFWGGFLLGVSVEIFGYSPNLLAGIFIGALVDLVVVGGGWLTIYYQDIAQRKLNKMRDQHKYE
jgi:hypothetical protein